MRFNIVSEYRILYCLPAPNSLLATIITRTFGKYCTTHKNAQCCARFLWLHYQLVVESFDIFTHILQGCSYRMLASVLVTLQWRHNERDGVSNRQPRDCLLNGVFRRKSKRTSKLRVTGLCAGISPVTGEFPAQMASNAGNVFIWWRHHGSNPEGCWWHRPLSNRNKMKHIASIISGKQDTKQSHLQTHTTSMATKKWQTFCTRHFQTLSWEETFVYWIKFHWNFSLPHLRVRLTTNYYWCT